MKTEKQLPRKALLARQQLMLCADILEMAITNELTQAILPRVPKNEIKMRLKRIRADAEAITRPLTKEIMAGDKGEEVGQEYAYAFYQIINYLRRWSADDLYDLVDKLKKQENGEK